MTERAHLFLPLNWRNALAYYAQGLVVPHDALTKYRHDLLELAPRRLPLLTSAISRSVSEMCASTTGDFPVALEIDSGVSVRGEELDLDGTCAAVAPIGVIPTSHVSCVHVRTDTDREEFQARRYRNIDTERPPVTVSPSLFRGDGVQAERLSTWLRGLPNPGVFEQRDLIVRQCASGALMLVLSSLSPDSRILESAEKIPEKVLDRSGTRGVLSALSETLAEIGWISPGDDLSMCATTLEVLTEMSGSEPPVASEVVTRMRQLLAIRDLSDAQLVVDHLDRILAIIHGEAAFTSFRQPGGLRATKGLLLFLLRPDPSAVGTWLQEEINAEAEVIALAAAFAGIIHRSTGLPPELRGSDVLQHLLLDWIAAGVDSPDIDLPHSTAYVVKLAHQGLSWR